MAATGSSESLERSGLSLLMLGKSTTPPSVDLSLAVLSRMHPWGKRNFQSGELKRKENMIKQSRILHTCTSILALTLLLIGSATAAPTGSTAAGSSNETCLGCHGPFDKLTSATANYTMPGGEKTSPHRYVDHDSKDIPECSNCHKPHPVPLTSTKGLPKANVEWCYSCHHMKVFQRCDTCHK